MEVTLRRIVLALALLFACSEQTEQATELIVVVDSDLDVPDELDQITVKARGPGARSQTASAGLGPDQVALPRSLALRHLGGPLGPVSVEVEGKLAGRSVVVRAAETSFIEGRSVVLALHLVRSCVELSCGDGETCTEYGCSELAIDASKLTEWNGEKPRLGAHLGGEDDAGALDSGVEPDVDAGANVDAETVDAQASNEASTSDANVPDGSGQDAGSDATQCVPRSEICNNLDDNCNGIIDDNFDLSTDVLNCGRCGNRCNISRGDVCCRGSCARGCP